MLMKLVDAQCTPTAVSQLTLACFSSLAMSKNIVREKKASAQQLGKQWVMFANLAMRAG